MDCGVGLGYISSALLPGEKQGLGLSVAFTYNTDEDDGSRAGVEWSISPGYYYFFSGIGKRGLNLGIGSRIILGERGSGTNPLMFNLGFQF